MKLARVASGPLERFLRIEAASGILLLLTAVIALAWANSPWVDTYRAIWHTTIGLTVGQFAFARSLEWYVNDVLMVIFFFVVGLEIRREISQGELSEWRRAALPVVAALGGMLAPAGLYLALAHDPSTQMGWGVPMATDIAFAVGILALLGKRVPAALRVLLLALAVIDDLGAIIVIALFYSSGIDASGLLAAGGGLCGLAVMQRFGVRAKVAYLLPGFAIWAGIYSAGIHPTIAGVIIGLATPVRAWFGPERFVSGVRKEMDVLESGSARELSSHEVAGVLRNVDLARREALSPAESLIEQLHPWVAYAIMPIFALANAGVTVPAGSMQGASSQVALAVVVGLLIGKPLGIVGATWLTLRLGISKLPSGVSTRHIVVLGTVAGVGFTMALFVAQLAFEDAALLGAAKLGVLAASGAAGVVSLLLGRALLKATPIAGAAHTADEAERSTEK
jgi:NhaA family Na+:H+ antiporter